MTTPIDINLDTRVCGRGGNTKYIVSDVDAVRFDQGGAVKFINNLDPKVDVEVRFYPAGVTKDDQSVVTGFCQEHPSATVVTVPKDGGYLVCTSNKPYETYAFEVKTPEGTPPGQTHETLDPVIIISPEVAQLKESPPLGPVQLGLALLLVAVAALAAYMGARAGARTRG